MPFRPHDLLWLRPGSFEPAAELPAWLDDAAPVVVRRDVVAGDRIPAGARGLQRNQRCAGYVHADAVVRCVSPEMLSEPIEPCDWPCVAALLSLKPQLDALGLDWGPVGGAGFWLATGLPVLRPDSDLDLLVRAPARLETAVIAALCALRDSAACRLDIQIDTGAGGFALSEYARGAGRVLLKTAHGPMLVADPWEALEPG
ncbi:malonate decarboxylase holo-ACP synthase [Massilia terrae]|uniref:Malonate decarboxylase holo-ACP synthase n=1 Tax=Massilia terrae TaxID=1811224 RepID=A0ABT2CS43_9BURK|nr:malonate decarboxylase holo-ACP synthase [Massilia terrae]MCS0656805.1 malonate decarboxylase holo-ACP synthase [Massilia terrae]